MVTDLFHLQDHVAVVTGASRGIGKGIAIGFAQAGAKVVIGSRSEEDLAMVVDEIEAFGGEAVYVAGSLSERTGMQQLVDTAVSEFGGVSTVVNNVGGSMPSALWIRLSVRLVMRWSGM
ncbi:MAG: hypothetical protein CM15mP49_23600 [Actinomycetota bacterium]|nr:MAG: hypothetical protein CM15mP49_23600 [Actinomycetota bacterium]